MSDARHPLPAPGQRIQVQRVEPGVSDVPAPPVGLASAAAPPTVPASAAAPPAGLASASAPLPGPTPVSVPRSTAPPLPENIRRHLSKSIGAGIFDPETGVLRLRNNSMLPGHLDKMERTLVERLDSVYTFVHLVAGYMPGMTLQMLWQGDAQGSGALTQLLQRNEELLQNAQPRNAGMMVEELNAPPGFATEGADAGPRGADSASAIKANFSAGNMLIQLLNKPTLSETHLRAFDMLLYHNARYIPPGGHQTYTPSETIDLARKWLVLQRYFQIDGLDNTQFRPPDDHEWYPLFLHEQLHSPLLSARDAVWDICGHSEVPLQDLMTQPRVRNRFAQMVALQAQVNMSTVPYRSGSASSHNELSQRWMAMIALFRTLRYTEGGELVFARTYDPAKEEARHARERQRESGAFLGGVVTSGSATAALRNLDMQPISAAIGGHDRERDRPGDRILRAFGAATTRMSVGGRARFVNANEL